MADNESFFRKVVRFVANPATDWSELNAKPEDSRELELEKSELKAMIERKRRNDFVRKREFDMLRKVRREGLSGEQLAALGGSSRLDDSEVRLQEPGVARPDQGVKAKIDEIEQQMVGEGGLRSTRRGTLGDPPSVKGALARLTNTQPGALGTTGASLSGSARASRSTEDVAPDFTGLEPANPTEDRADVLPERLGAPPAEPGIPNPPRVAAAAPVQMGHGLPPLGLDLPMGGASPGDPAWPSLDSLSGLPDLSGLSGLTGLSAPSRAPTLAPSPAAARRTPATPGLDLHPAANAAATGLARPTGTPAASPPVVLVSPQNPTLAVEISEVVHDPDLDEAVIAFANADFTQCETALQQLTAPAGPRAQHAETWLVLFDLYRAIGQQQRFEHLALDYAQRFGSSAPQWFSLPKLVADAAAEEPPRTRGSGRRSAAAELADTAAASAVGWLCPDQLDIEAVARLRSQTLQLPLPWVLDWSQLERVDPEAAMQLSTLFRLWAGQALAMRWVAGDRLLQVLQESAPTGVRDADPVYWLARLDALRLANRADQFDEAAIDYCVTYEVSPPSWEPARCIVRLSGSRPNTRNPQMSIISEVSTSFAESSLLGESAEHGAMVTTAHVELSGQLVGDIGATLSKLDGALGAAQLVSVSCTRLIRVDFLAAGDLLNWVLAKQKEDREVHFVDAHRLLALFFGAMGINEHARVRVRKV
jgi:hypothetical protein